MEVDTIPHNPSPQRISNVSKTSLVPSYTMRKQLTQHFSPHSVPLQHSKANSTWAVADACPQLLDYIATHPNVGIWYKVCNMVLSVHMVASYLSEPGGKSRAAGHFYLSNCNDKDFNNGPILTLSTIIKHVMLLASKAELAALCYGCKLAAPL
jgi:hypothetical protein